MQKVTLRFLSILSFISCFCCVNDIKAQNQPLADSLIQVLENEELDSLERLEVLEAITLSTTSSDDLIQYSELLLRLAESANQKSYVAIALNRLGIAKRRKGKLEEAIEFFIKSSKVCVENQFLPTLVLNYGEISTTYTLNGDIDNAIKYDKKATEISRKTKDESLLPQILLNTGFDYYTLNKYDSALLYYNQADSIFTSSKSKWKLLPAYIIGNRALVKWKLGSIDEAIIDLNKAIDMLKPLGDNYAMADYHNQLGNIYLEQDSLEQAVSNLSAGVRLAQREDLKEQVRDASKLLSEIYGKLGASDSAYHYLNLYLAMRDSIQSEETTLELANQRADFEIGLKEEEVEKLEQRSQKQLMIAIASGSLIIIVGFIGYRYQQRRSRKKLEKQSIDKRLAELTALKAQINPHFLFNALNSIQSYILEGEQDIAEDYLIKYGKLMRMILDHSNDLLVSLDEEIKLLKLYVELEQIRIDGGFDYNIEIDESIDPLRTNIPSMVIQPFLENAIWHGVSNQAGTGIITLQIQLSAEEENVVVVIEDNGAGFDTSEPRKETSKGVTLVKERLELLKETKGSESVVAIESDVGAGTCVSLRFPNDLA